MIPFASVEALALTTGLRIHTNKLDSQCVFVFFPHPGVVVEEEVSHSFKKKKMPLVFIFKTGDTNPVLCVTVYGPLKKVLSSVVLNFDKILIFWDFIFHLNISSND